MKHTSRKKVSLNQNQSLLEYDINKSLTGCVPCLEKAKKIDRQVNGRRLNEIKIEEIKEIVRSIFESSDDSIKKI